MSDTSSFIKLLHNDRFKLVVFLFLASCIMAVSLTFFVLSSTKPYMGVRLFLKEGNWSVQMIDNTGIAVKAGIKIGDVPVEINGQPAASFLERYKDNGTVYGMLISQMTVIDGKGQLKSADINKNPQSAESLTELFTFFVISLIFWIVGFYVFFKKPKSLPAMLFCAGSIDLGLAFSASMANARAIPASLQLEAVASTVGPWLLVHFFHILPEERTRTRTDPIIYLIYVIPAITLLLLPFIGYSNGQPEPWFRSVRIFEYGAGFLAAASIAIVNYLRAGSFKTRQQMKIVLVSCLIALVPFAVLSALPDAIWKLPIIPSQFGLLFIAFIPLGMGYAIVTQKLMDIEVFIRRGMIYGLITLIMAIILAVAIYTVLLLQKSPGIAEEILLSIILGGIATALLGPIKKSAETVVDRFLYKDRYDYRQTIQAISSTLNALRDSNTISRFIVGTAVNTLNLGGGCLFGRSKSNVFEIAVAQGKLSEPGKQTQLLSLIDKKTPLIEFPNSALAYDPEVSLIIPLKAGEVEIGVLCLSPKLSRQSFSNDDMYFLQSLGSIAASALRSAMLIQDVSLRDTFVSTASHELRTPLTSVMGYADLLLRRDPPEPTRKQWAKNIFDNSQKIAAMLDDLLNISRIQSGKINMKLEEVQLPPILSEKLAIFGESSDRHEFVIHVDRDLPEAIIDRDKFGQVVANLLSNAVKYSPNGGRIMLAARNDSENHRIVISVSDQGIGIGQADRDSLFMTFHRIQRPETVGIRGSGLGLFIVKEWIQAMGGQIWFESELNKGSTFFIAIPASLGKGPVTNTNN